MGTMGTPAVFETFRVSSGNEDFVNLNDNTRQVQVSAIAGDCYVSPNAATHPPALDEMSSDDHWDGAIILEGQTRVFSFRDSDVPDDKLYLGPVTPDAGPCVVSVFGLVN